VEGERSSRPFSWSRSLLKPSKLLLFLLAVDAIFILLHVLFDLGLLSDRRFLLGRDNGYAEMFGYLKEGGIILASCALAVRARQSLYVAWAALFLYMLLDDSLLLHERVLGSALRQILGLGRKDVVLGMNARDLVENTMLALLALLILGIMVVVYHFGDRAFKKMSRGLFILLAALAFCGVVVDFIHAVIVRSTLRREYSEVNSLLAILEDGGELVIISFILWFVVLSWRGA
jgi:hypothetical protein